MASPHFCKHTAHSGVINVQAINAKTNLPRPIPMTRRVKEELARLSETSQGNLIFG